MKKTVIVAALAVFLGACDASVQEYRETLNHEYVACLSESALNEFTKADTDVERRHLYNIMACFTPKPGIKFEVLQHRPFIAKVLIRNGSQGSMVWWVPIESVLIEADL